jgi:hypothetical protein
MTLSVTHAAPGVHRLSNVYTNWYLLEAGGRLTVLDAGLPGDWREFLSALSRLGHAPVESLDVLAATNAKTVLPGYGEPWPHGIKSAVNIARDPG